MRTQFELSFASVVNFGFNCMMFVVGLVLVYKLVPYIVANWQ